MLHWLSDVSDCGQESEDSAVINLVRDLTPDPHVLEHELHDPHDDHLQVGDRFPRALELILVS